MNESECQSIVNKWAKLYGYDDPPKVVFGSLPVDDEEPLYRARFSDDPPEICIDPEQIILVILAHEFVHWLQYKEHGEVDEKSAEERGQKLARNEIIGRARQYHLPFV